MLIRGLVGGLALSACSTAAFVLLVAAGASPLSVAASLAGVAVAGLLAGGWAAGRAEPSEERLRNLWRACATLTAVAGVTVTVTEWGRGMAGGLGLTVLLILVVGAPAYAIGMLLRSVDRLAIASGSEEMNGESGTSRLLAGALAGVAAGPFLIEVVAGYGGSAGPILLAVSAVLIFPTFTPTLPASPVLRERLVAEECSPFAYLQVVEIQRKGRPPERRMVLDGEEQGGEEVRAGQPTAPYLRALDEWLAIRGAGGDRYLFLGGGAYTLPRRVRERDARAGITVVERDPVVTRLATAAFGLRPIHEVRTESADARAWIDRVSDTDSYDHLVLDVYDGNQRVPASLLTLEALEGMSRLLRPGGMWSANLIGMMEGGNAPVLWSAVEAVRASFAHVRLYPHFGQDFPEPQNVLVLASDEPFDAPDRLHGFELREATPPSGPVYLIRDMGVERVDPDDAAEVDPGLGESPS